MAESTTDVPGHLASIKQDVSELLRTVAKLASETDLIKKGLGNRYDEAAKVAATAGDWIMDRAESLGGDAVQIAERGGVAAMTELRAQIRRNPLIAVLIALGLGVAVSLVGRRSAPMPSPSRRQRVAR